MVQRGTTRGFLKTVSESVKRFEGDPEKILQEAVLDLYIAMRDATPVDTGNLRDAWVVSKSGVPQPAMPTGPENNGVLTSGINESLSNISGLKVGDRASILNRATYFLRLERGFTGYDSLGRYYTQPGRWFARTTGAKWRSILRATAAKYRMEAK